IAMVVVLLGLCCQGCPKPTPVPVTPISVGDAAWDGSTPATCLDLCRRGQALGCAWANPTPAGANCVDVCVNNQNARIAPWDLNCRARATSCAAVDQCQ